MASPTHRDNILLPAYEEIGFGVANGANYQGNENTVVVAMYGDPTIGTDPTLAAPVQVSPPIEVAPVTEVATETTAFETETPAKADTSAKTLVAEEIIEDNGRVNTLTYLANTQKQVTNFDSLLSGDASWAMYTTVMILGLLAFAYLYRHITFINVVVTQGEQMIVAHPLLESSIIFVALWLLLGASYGTIL